MAVTVGEDGNGNRATPKEKPAFSPALVLTLILYPTLLGLVFAARLATFALLIPTPTIPGGDAPSSSDATGRLRHVAHDQWDTSGAGAILRTAFAFASVAVAHIGVVLNLVRGHPGVDAVCAWAASAALWFTTTCFVFTYASLARYGTQDWEWLLAVMVSASLMATMFLSED